MHGLMMDFPLTIHSILEHGYRLFSDVTVTTRLPDGNTHRYTYGDMYRRVKRMSSALEKLGVQVGDRVGTFGWNNYQHLELYYAIPGCGAVCHTLNIRLTHDQLGYIIEHAEDKVIFVDASLMPLFNTISEYLGNVETIVLYNAEPGFETSLPNVRFYEELLATGDEDYDWPVTDERAAMGLCYTSGTTGHPKGALYSHRSMYLHTLGVLQANSLAVDQTDVVLPVVPQFHAMAWGLPYACCMAGAALVMPGPFLQGKPLADMIAEEGVTIAAGVPTIWNGLYQELVANPRELALKELVVGGSAMPRGLTANYESNLGVEVLHAWGMTETSPLGTSCRLPRGHQDMSDEQKWDIKAMQGRPVGGVELRIVDDAGKELPWDGRTLGELQVRGPWVVSCYYKREVNPENFTDDGWFRTGDVVSMTPGGYMKIGDRTKDLVKSGGEWISSVELENAVMAHPKVAEAAVIAIPDEKWSERPLVALVPAEGETVTGEEINEHLAPTFPKYWLPEKYAFIDTVPKTSVGKFDKKVLRAMYAEGKL
ncbi:MAG: long-chain fatty acid--CoA ligase [Acidobacteriota bacterium]|nr:long-chain fatty acid--CoA ligase [Acidobacteriota bacterium]